jgi:hypothetical protein
LRQQLRAEGVEGSRSRCSQPLSLVSSVPHCLGLGVAVFGYPLAPAFQLLDSTHQCLFILCLDSTGDGTVVGPHPLPSLGILLS